MTSLAHWSFLGGTPGLPLGVYVKRHAQRRSLVSTRLGILVLTGSRRRRQPTRPGAQKRAAAAADRAVLVGEPGDLPERRNVRPQPDDGSTLVLLVPGPFSWDMVPNARRRRLLRGRRTLLPRLGVRVGERTPVPPMGPGHRVTLPELRRGRRPTQLLQECRLQAPSLVSRVERPAAALGILPRSSMRHRATVGLAAFHRGPADEPSGPTDHVGGDPSTVADHTGGRSCDDDGGGDRGTATHPQTGVGHVRAPLTAEAAAHRRRLGDAGGVAPVDGGHLVARQVQGKDLPLRRHLDLRMLGPQRRPLLPRQVFLGPNEILFFGIPRRVAGGFLSRRSVGAERRFLVALGKSALNRTDALEQMFAVEQIIRHPDFNNDQGNYDNDVALLKLKSRANGGCARESAGARRACLPAGSPEVPDVAAGLPCEIAGFGKEKRGLWYHSQRLRRAHVKVLAHAVCRRSDYYGHKINHNMLCAGRPDWTRDACEGDSGGPLVCQVDGLFVLTGVISWGEGCARQRRPGVYAKVKNYVPWIRRYVPI
ncbi:uncharacterized protein LOC144211443 isoform X3 [Stigmatopora nigra]